MCVDWTGKIYYDIVIYYNYKINDANDDDDDDDDDDHDHDDYDDDDKMKNKKPTENTDKKQ